MRESTVPANNEPGGFGILRGMSSFAFRFMMATGLIYIGYQAFRFARGFFSPQPEQVFADTVVWAAELASVGSALGTVAGETTGMFDRVQAYGRRLLELRNVDATVEQFRDIERSMRGAVHFIAPRVGVPGAGMGGVEHRAQEQAQQGEPVQPARRARTSQRPPRH